MTERIRTQCRHCSNPDRDGPDGYRGDPRKCRYFWYRDDEADYLAKTSGMRPCDDERRSEAANDDRYQDEASMAEREFKRQRFWRRVFWWGWVIFMCSLVIFTGHHWVHR